MKGYNVKLLPLLAALILLGACSKELTEKTSQAGDLVINSIYPTTAHAGEKITVYGKNLMSDTSGFTLRVNNKKAAITRFTNDSISAIVPDKAGSGKVVIKMGNKTYNGPELSYVYEVIVTTIAGTGAVGNEDGSLCNNSFNCPWGIVADDNGDLYVADTYNRLIRKITRSNQQVSTIPIPVLVGGANFYSPYNIAIDKKSKSLYVTDFNAHLMKISSNGDQAVIFNDAMALAGIAVGPDNRLYVSNNTTGEIFRLDTTGQNKTIYVSGIVTPRNIIFDKNNIMYVGAYGIYKITGAGNYSTIIDPALFHGWEIAVDSSGNFYEADHFNNVIRKIEPNGTITVIAGNGDASDVDGKGLNASFNGPQGITIDKDGNLYVTTFNYSNNTGNKIRKVIFR